jgi:hypothetical protein
VGAENPSRGNLPVTGAADHSLFNRLAGLIAGVMVPESPTVRIAASIGPPPQNNGCLTGRYPYNVTLWIRHQRRETAAPTAMPCWLRINF